MVGTYSQAFPLAPRDARDKAKERERAKSKTIDSPKVLPINSLKAVNATAASQNQERDTDVRRGGITLSDSASAPPADADIQPGDLLNGVGSASSHESTISEVFSNASAAATSSNPATTLTPLTIPESSPIDPQQSRRNSKIETTVPLRNGFSEHSAVSNVKSQSSSHATSHGAPSRNPLPTTRVQMRQPGIKGEKTIYDPDLLLYQLKITKEEAKKAKAETVTFGEVVCTHYNISLRGASSF